MEGSDDAHGGAVLYVQSDLRHYLLAAYIISAYFALLLLYMIGPVPSDRLVPIKEILNFLTPLIGVLFGHFFNSTMNSRRKDETLMNVVSTLKSAQNAAAPPGVVAPHEATVTPPVEQVEGRRTP